MKERRRYSVPPIIKGQHILIGKPLAFLPLELIFALFSSVTDGFLPTFLVTAGDFR